MRHRPLCMISLLLVLIYSAVIVIGGAKFVKELRPSGIEVHVPDGENIQVAGEIYQKEEKEDYQILYLKNNSVNYQEQSFKESKLIIYDEKKEKTCIGNYIVANGETSIYQKERNPGNFNQKLYYQKQGISAMMWAESIQVSEGMSKKKWNCIKEQLYQFRDAWKQQLYDAMGEENGAILTAMLLGEKGDMDADTKELYQRNGIGHILAISGLHLSVIGVGLYRMIRRVTGSYAVGGIAGVLFLSSYILMIGVGVSVVRAFVMFLFRVGADMVGRKYDSLTALSVAASVVLLWRPLYLYDGGFWLSFGAVLAVMIVLPMFRKLPVQAFWASISINCVLFPAQCYFFYEFPIYSLLLNLWVIPLMSAVLFLGIIGSITVGIGMPGQLLLRLCNLIFFIYEKSCEVAMRMPGACVVIGQPQLWQIAVCEVLLILAVLLGRRAWKIVDKEKAKAVRLRRMGWLVSVVAVSVIPLGNTVRWRGNLQITMMDVGQGDGTFLRSPSGNVYVIDGGSSDVEQVGQYRMEPFLESQGVQKIQYLLITHGDEDHTNGWIELIEDKNSIMNIETIIFPTKEVWDENLYSLARKAEQRNIKVAYMQKGSIIRDGELQIECLGPEPEYSGETGNAASLLLRVNYQGFDMLFTGDAEGEGEEALQEVLNQELQAVSWEALKVAHHGSKNSSSEELLEQIQPTYALISAGQENRYGHPHQETLERLERVGSQVFTTKEKGAITLVTDGEKMWIKTHL